MLPEKLINYAVYHEGTDLLGTADVTLPSLEMMTETVKGAGLAGEVNSPAIGHFGSMTVQLTWRTVTRRAATLLDNNGQSLEFRASQQHRDPQSGALSHKPLKVVIRGNGTKFEMGKLDVAVTTGSTSELEVIYLKVVEAGEEIVEIDKFNHKCKINGKDLLAGIRDDLGK